MQSTAPEPVEELDLLTATLIVSLGLVLLNLWERRRRQRGQPPLFAAQWSVKDLLEAAVLVFLLVSFSGAVVLLLTGWESQSLQVPLVLLLPQSLGMVGGVSWYVRVKYRRPWAELGLRPDPHWAGRFGLGVSYGVLTPFLAGLVTVLALVLLGTFLSPEGLNRLIAAEEQNSFYQFIQALFFQASGGWMVWGTILFVVVGPVAEEIFFRGFAYQTLRRRFGEPTAMLGSSLLFSLAHGRLLAAPGLFAIGLVFVRLYQRTGTLVTSMAAHAIHNALLLLILLAAVTFGGTGG